VCGFAADDDFTYGYRGGVFPGNALDVDHDVEVIGWGNDEAGTPYWLCRNSWGTYWGEQGFFRVPRAPCAKPADILIYIRRCLERHFPHAC